MSFPNEEYGRVDRLFAINNQANLERHWVLADAARIIHHLEYNEELLDPRLTNGWMEIRNFYRLLGHHHILIGYVSAGRWGNCVSEKVLEVISGFGFRTLHRYMCCLGRHEPSTVPPASNHPRMTSSPPPKHQNSTLTPRTHNIAFTHPWTNQGLAQPPLSSTTSLEEPSGYPCVCNRLLVLPWPT
ncbi:hypothetical protein ACSQ67_003411 [Phaseolus vulgaris]